MSFQATFENHWYRIRNTPPISSGRSRGRGARAPSPGKKKRVNVNFYPFWWDGPSPLALKGGGGRIFQIFEGKQKLVLTTTTPPPSHHWANCRPAVSLLNIFSRTGPSPLSPASSAPCPSMCQCSGAHVFSPLYKNPHAFPSSHNISTICTFRYFKSNDKYRGMWNV